jgi:hypothetical protein
MKESITSTVNNNSNDLEKELKHQKAETLKAKNKFIGLFNNATKEEYHYMCDKLESSYYVALDTYEKLIIEGE